MSRYRILDCDAEWGDTENRWYEDGFYVVDTHKDEFAEGTTWYATREEAEHALDGVERIRSALAVDIECVEQFDHLNADTASDGRLVWQEEED